MSQNDKIPDLSYDICMNRPVWDSITRIPSWDGAQVLYVGCGSGLLSRYLASLGSHVVSMDKQPPESTGGLNFVQGSMEKLPFPDASFDAIISCSSMQYCDHPTTFREMSRALKHNGTILLHENGKRNPIALLARRIRERRAADDQNLRAYLDEIKEYVDRRSPWGEAGLELTHFSPHYILGPVCHYLSEAALRRLYGLDRLVLGLGALRDMGWFNTFHLRKAGHPMAGERSA